MDVTPIFNDALRRHDKAPTRPHVFDLDSVEAFLKEAYRINKHIAELNQYLHSIRQSYLSAAQPPRRRQLARTNSSTSIPRSEKERKYLTDAQREQIDAETKQLLRELTGAIKNLSDAEKVRQSADETIALRKRATKGLGALGRWAAGGAITAKSPEEELEEAKQNTIKIHRDGVIWYLSRKLEEVSGFQASMMEIRLEREREKSKSVLYKARGLNLPAMDGPSGGHEAGAKAAGWDETSGQQVEQQLSEEQLQLFAEENQDMLKHYEDTLDKVRATERSLLEISELQSTLATNLFEQQAQIDQLVQDSHLTAENVGSGNKELKKATERKSIAQAIFYATCAMCGTLVVWDLII
ncbi:Snare protein syntaxin 18 ufe1 protein [Neofusicoccum parvum]|uniref:Snare protein syntaxin 18 ufe1 protein n=1 Tax=Neofusicoccum parvum TaxID=310453 RepID=A0ACB5RU30_9PEZI|nr:Snare protein syntaxin 18 ufe1 protein [Neofusicoccum parvum]